MLLGNKFATKKIQPSTRQTQNSYKWNSTKINFNYSWGLHGGREGKISDYGRNKLATKSFPFFTLREHKLMIGGKTLRHEPSSILVWHFVDEIKYVFEVGCKFKIAMNFPDNSADMWAEGKC